MKNITLTSIIAISIAAPAFGAVGDLKINKNASSAPCTSATLDTPTGPAALEADWTANTITINWDAKNGTTLPSTQCTYDDTITLPATPTKAGYTFGGWAVKVSGGGQSGPAQCSLSGLDTSVFPDDYGHSGMTWYADFSYGRVAGEALCSSTETSFDELGTPDETANSGSYCWCRATSYTPTGSEACSVSSPVWVGCYSDFEDDSECADSCGFECSNCVSMEEGSYLIKLFGQSN